MYSFKNYCALPGFTGALNINGLANPTALALLKLPKKQGLSGLLAHPSSASVAVNMSFAPPNGYVSELTCAALLGVRGGSPQSPDFAASGTDNGSPYTIGLSARFTGAQNIILRDATYTVGNTVNSVAYAFTANWTFNNPQDAFLSQLWFGSFFPKYPRRTASGAAVSNSELVQFDSGLLDALRKGVRREVQLEYWFTREEWAANDGGAEFLAAGPGTEFIALLDAPTALNRPETFHGVVSSANYSRQGTGAKMMYILKISALECL